MEFDAADQLEAEDRAGKSSAQQICGKCRRGFETKDELERHLKEHVKIKAMTKVRKRRIVCRKFDNQCKYCDKSFQKPSQLVRHERIHTGEKPFKVIYCVLTSHSLLSDHQV